MFPSLYKVANNYLVTKVYSKDLESVDNIRDQKIKKKKRKRVLRDLAQFCNLFLFRMVSQFKVTPTTRAATVPIPMYHQEQQRLLQ